MIKDTPDKELQKTMRLIKAIRPDCAEVLAKVDAYFCKHLREDLGSYEFGEYMDYIEKRLVYEVGAINLGVIMNWGRDFRLDKTRTWTAEEKKVRDNFYTGTIDTTN